MQAQSADGRGRDRVPGSGVPGGREGAPAQEGDRAQAGVQSPVSV